MLVHDRKTDTVREISQTLWNLSLGKHNPTIKVDGRDVKRYEIVEEVKEEEKPKRTRKKKVSLVDGITVEPTKED